MDIVVCCKFTPDIQDMEVRADGSVSFERAQWQIGDYDLQAIEAGAQLAAATGGSLKALSVGGRQLETGRLQKDLLSRGPEELHVVVDDRLADADVALTAELLACAVREIGADAVIFGEGSADCYCQQTGLQVGERLGWATVNAVDAIEAKDGALRVERLLEDEVEVLEVPLPAALMVTSSINNPPVPGMKAVLAAGKKPVVRHDAEGLVGDLAGRIEVEKTAAAQMARRKNVVIEGSVDEAVAKLVASLGNDGVL